MIAQEEVYRGSAIAIFMGLYGIYLMWSAIMILWKKKQILDPSKKIQFFFMRLFGKNDQVLKYEKRLKEEKKWPQYGKFVFVIALVCIFFAYRMWMIVH